MTRVLPRPAFEALLNDLITIIVDFSPELTKGGCTPVEHANVVEYAKKLGKVKSTVQQELTEKVYETKTELTRDQFVEAMEHNLLEHPRLFTPRGLREYMMLTYEKLPEAAPAPANTF
jgi:hypothetical protein